MLKTLTSKRINEVYKYCIKEQERLRKLEEKNVHIFFPKDLKLIVAENLKDKKQIENFLKKYNIKYRLGVGIKVR